MIRPLGGKKLDARRNTTDEYGMSGPGGAKHEYLRGAVLTASPEQLHLMLLDGAIRFCVQGLDAIARQDIEGNFNALDRAQRIVLQMRAGLNREISPQLVDQMSALYHYIYMQLVDGSVQRNATAIENALKILRHQRETWVMLIEKLARENPQAAAPAAPAAQPTLGHADADAAPAAELGLVLEG
ncbi:MAG: hypothetical protein CHACPFDD_03214 [Phycisphaerae bacterium]|nr:hypothetical protein [Phycisphaerae bacterium]